MSDAPDSFDQVLGGAMRSRPLPAPIAGLDARAIALAQRQEATEATRRARLASLRRWGRGTEWVAAALILIVMLLVPALTSGDVQPDADLTFQSTGAMDDELVATFDAFDLEMLCGAVVLGSLMYVAVSTAVSAPRPAIAERM